MNFKMHIYFFFTHMLLILTDIFCATLIHNAFKIPVHPLHTGSKLSQSKIKYWGPKLDFWYALSFVLKSWFKVTVHPSITITAGKVWGRLSQERNYAPDKWCQMNNWSIYSVQIELGPNTSKYQIHNSKIMISFPAGWDNKLRPWWLIIVVHK